MCLTRPCKRKIVTFCPPGSSFATAAHALGWGRKSYFQFFYPPHLVTCLKLRDRSFRRSWNHYHSSKSDFAVDRIHCQIFWHRTQGPFGYGHNLAYCKPGSSCSDCLCQHNTSAPKSWCIFHPQTRPCYNYW